MNADFGLNVLVLTAIALGTVAVILTAIIVLRLEREQWPHGHARICPDPGCVCWRSAARRLTKKGPLL